MVLFGRPRTADVFDGMVDYLVDTPDGSVGVLDGWRRDEHGRPQALIVAQGWFGRHRIEIPLDAVLETDHDDRRIVLARGAAPLEPAGPFQWLAGRAEQPSPEGDADASPVGTRQRPVLCGLAVDPHAPQVLAVAARLATKLKAPLVIAHVTPGDGISAVPAEGAPPLDEETKDAKTLIDAFLPKSATSTAVRRIVAPGLPAETLEKLVETEGAQLLVIGASRKGFLSALFTGSVSRHMFRHAPCPVVVVPPNLRELDEDGGDNTRDIPVLAGARGLGRASR